MVEIRLDAPTKFRVIRTEDGRLHCEGSFCCDGVLEYRQPDGSIVHELRRPETNAELATVESFKLLPLVIEHPYVGLLNSESYKDYTVGMTDSSAYYDKTEGVIKGLVSFFDAKAIALIDAREKEQLSAGYTCDIKQGEGVWNGQHYDREQINVRANHLALTSRGRAGGDVRLRLDSAAGIGQAVAGQAVAGQAVAGQAVAGQAVAGQVIENPSNPNKTNDNGDNEQRMAIVRCDGVEYSGIPESFASISGTRFRELKELKERHDSLVTRFDTTSRENRKLEAARENYQFRLDNLEIIVDNADNVLGELGYYRNDMGQYVRVDGGKKKMMPPVPEDEEMMEEEDNEEEEMMEEWDVAEEEETTTSKKKKKSKPRVDSNDEDESACRGDSVGDLLAIWKEADSLLPGFSDARFDSSFSTSDIKRTLLAEIEPNMDLTFRSDSYVDGVFAYVQENYDSSPTDPGDKEEGDDEEEEDRDDGDDGDSEEFSHRLDSILKRPAQSTYGDELTEGERRRVHAYKQPLTIGKTRMGVTR
jgi:hypothetical protein